MQIIDHDLEIEIKNDIVKNALQRKYAQTINHMSNVLEELYNNLPEKKRVSFGRVYTVRVLSEYLFSSLKELNANVFEIGVSLFERSKYFLSKGVALGILSFYGIEDYAKVIPYFEVSAKSSDWKMREFAQMFFRKLIKNWPDEMKSYLLKLTRSESSTIRRFVSETLRPVRENRWFYKNPNYSLSILRNLFNENSGYPRTSVGNNLSDLARHLPELVFELVKELVASGNPNSYWIAYRACRNLVKKDPIRVMDLLYVDEYRYKKRVHRRSDYPGNQSEVNFT